MSTSYENELARVPAFAVVWDIAIFVVCGLDTAFQQ